MDFHGNIEVMLFSDKLEQLEAMNLDEPVAFKVKVTHTEMFTRTSVTKIMTLAQAKKECRKTQTKIVEKPQEPLVLRLHLDHDMQRLEELYRLVRRYPGKRPLKLTIVSKLQNVVIDSAIRVNNEIMEELMKFEDVDVA